MPNSGGRRRANSGATQAGRRRARGSFTIDGGRWWRARQWRAGATGATLATLATLAGGCDSGRAGATLAGILRDFRKYALTTPPTSTTPIDPKTLPARHLGPVVVVGRIVAMVPDTVVSVERVAGYVTTMPILLLATLQSTFPSLREHTI